MTKTVLLLFGATGDLVAKKIVPALYDLYCKQKLPADFQIVGVSRRPISSHEFREKMSEAISSKQQEASSKGFLDLFSFHQLQFENEADYRSLAASLAPSSNRLIYLAVPPEHYPSIFKHIVRASLVVRRVSPAVFFDQATPDSRRPSPEAEMPEAWHRLIVEKPFGMDLATAEAIEEQLATLFDESQIYRIDHYLAKDMLQNIMNFRFSNNLFEDNWNAKDIERIHIRLWEMIGVEHRGAFYDRVGAVRDVAQNHLLQMLALVTMDRPASFSAADVHAKRAAILQQLIVPTEDEIRRSTARAQYEGYRSIAGVRPDSETETYCRFRAFLDSSRWRGVPITIEAGKRMPEERNEISVTFRSPYKNTVTFTIEPKEGITIHFWSKKAGLETDLEERSFDFMLHTQSDRVQYIAEYEKLLLDCIAGDQTLFVSTDEVRAMWRFIDPILNAWQKNLVPLTTYTPGTDVSLSIAARSSHLAAGDYASHASDELAILGLGKMGANMARRMVDRGWRVIGWNRTHSVTVGLAKEGIEPAKTIRDAVAKLSANGTGHRILWLMLPAGDVVDHAIEELLPHLTPGDIVIDGGNSYYKDAGRRAHLLREKGIRFLDVGTSGGPGGARNGACLMIGGDRETFEEIEPLFRDVARDDGYRFFDGYGAGHFVKMIHNGIEYGMMQAIAEGFEILKRSDYHLDLSRAAEIYNRGSVIESRLVGWLENALRIHGEELANVSSTVAHTGEGAWTVKTAAEMGIEAQIIAGALAFRIASEQNPRYAGKIVSALREQFGGHDVKKKVG